MRKLVIWTETAESAEVISGYLMRLGVELLYTKLESKQIIANVDNMSGKDVESISRVILGAKGENHLSINE